MRPVPARRDQRFAFARPAAGSRDRRDVRRNPIEVDLRHLALRQDEAFALVRLPEGEIKKRDDIPPKTLKRMRGYRAAVLRQEASARKGKRP